MNATFSPRVICRLTFLLLGLALLNLFATTASAAAPCIDSTATMPILQANFVYELVADRARMIQVSLVFVALGCALIWWYR